MGKIRVLRIIARMNVGGPAVEISGLMRHLDPGRFEQRLVTGWCDSHEEDYLTTQAPDISVTRLEGLGRAVRPTDDARAFQQIIGHIREYRPHIIHTHTAKAGALGRSAAIFARGNPLLIHTYHGHILNGYFSKPKTQAIVQVERILATRTDRFITVGAQVRDELIAAKIGSLDKFAVIPPGLEVQPFPTRQAARAQLGLSEHDQVVCVVGRVTAIKRPDRVAEVARILAARFPRLVFIVAGAGDLEAELQATVDREQLPIKMLGWRDDVETIFAASDLALLTSDNEGTPLSLIQAALAGIPSVATNVGAVSEVVIDHETGLLASTDVADISEKLAILLSDESECSRLGNSGRMRAQQLYTVQRFANDHANLYEDALRSKLQTS